MDNVAQFIKPIQPISPELKQEAEQFHAQGYASRKRGDYKQAI
jgi:hypothetical protein